MNKKTEEFISEAIAPQGGSFDAGRMAGGEPGVPRQFTWRGKTFTVVKVRRSWRKLGACTHGSSDKYVRKHFYECETGDGGIMTIYFDRNPVKHKHGAPRWWLFSKERT